MWRCGDEQAKKQRKTSRVGGHVESEVKLDTLGEVPGRQPAKCSEVLRMHVWKSEDTRDI